MVTLEDCWFCNLQPPRLPEELYEELHFLPDPVLDPVSHQYKVFSEIYGTTTTEDDRPSLATALACVECNKPRCVYSPSLLTPAQKTALVRLKGPEESTFTCGSPIAMEPSPFVVRQGLQCSSPMETQYYSAKTCKFPDVCFHCGAGKSIAADEDIQALQRQYTTVRPICTGCKIKGKEPAVRGQRNVGKRQKKN